MTNVKSGIRNGDADLPSTKSKNYGAGVIRVQIVTCLASFLLSTLIQEAIRVEDVRRAVIVFVAAHLPAPRTVVQARVSWEILGAYHMLGMIIDFAGMVIPRYVSSSIEQ